MEDDSGWVFDSLVCFLNGPVWNAPLESFIDENSLVFEPNVPESVEYRKIFNDFKNLVDFMLGNFMDDIGIAPQQFERACAKGRQGGITLQFDQNIFEQIWAANDYEMFKRMMTQKNVELQLQALELIEQRYGITPAVFMPDKDVAHGSQTRTPEKKKSSLENQIMDEVVEKFDKEDAARNEVETVLDKNYFLEEKHILEEKLMQAFAKTKLTEAEKTTADSNKIKTAEDMSSTKATKTSLVDAKHPPEIFRPNTNEVDSQEIKKRQEYLRAQRDKLVALKKEVRKKHLQTDTVTRTKEANNRPKSAKKAAESILEGGVLTIEPQELAIRKALVEKLKSEIIDKRD